MSKSTNNLSGRAQSLARRKSKNSGGSSAAAGATRTRKPQVEAVIPASTKAVTAAIEKPTTKRPVRATQPISVAEGRAVSKLRRKQGTSGQAASKQSSSQAASRARPVPEQILEPREKTHKQPKARNRAAGVKPQIKSTVVESSGGRNLSKSRRKALTKGKVGATAYKTQSGQSSSVAKMANPDASTRDIAKAVRNERCSQGKTGCTTKSSKQQSRRKSIKASSEIEAVSSTLSGQAVSGTKVGQGQITGAETGACKIISGIEYLGTEEFKTHCSTTPEASPAKVAITRTNKGRTISGTEIGQAQAVTGDRAGVCSTVTGTEYIPADQGSSFCDSKAQGTVMAKAKTGASPVTSSANKKHKGGTNINVSGANAFPERSGSIQPNSKDGYDNRPTKVVASNTLAGNMTTGTQVGRGQAVTGDERGYCQSITGAGYQGKEEVEGVCNTKSTSTPAEKVSVSGTFGGQIVTGDRSGAIGGLTGASAGNCQPLSGSSYMDAGSLADNCSASDHTSLMQRAKQIKAKNMQSLTGVQPGLMGLTGAQKGACEVVSGTPYQSADQTSQMCESQQPATPGESDFPQVMGSTNNNQVAFSQAAPAAKALTSATTITGDGWDKGDKVTGIDGIWAAQRNPSIRGSQAQMPMGAANFRPHSMPEVPISPITGSSGNTGEGSKVTLSGGARA
ncbi:MAG: hypothetical protein JKY93_03440 [Gammaproteobacteria bacterium]|nr:hypothetical protein [Gammaproteobacteria bacterium]